MVGIEERSERRPRLGGEAEQLVVGEVVALLRPVAPAGLQQPQAGDVLEQPRRAADAALVGEVELAGARGNDWRAQLGAEQRPRARAQERAVTIRAHGGHGRAGVVARRRDDARAAERGVRVGTDVADERSRLDHPRQNPRRHVQHLQQVGRPLPRPRVDELRRRGVGELGRHLAGQPVVHEVRDGAEGDGGVDEPRRRAAGGVELIQRVERQELDAGDGVDLVGRDAFEDGFHDAVGALVAIVVRVLQEDALLADERVVAAPGVDADAVDGRAGGALHPLLELEPDAEDIPVERSVLPDRLVDEPVHLADVEHARAEPAEHGTAALGSEIERQKMSACRHRGFYGGPQDTLSARPTKRVSGAAALFRKPERAGRPDHQARRRPPCPG